MSQKMYSLHFGVNYVDRAHYGDVLTDLPCCSSDANYMMGLMQKLGFDDSKIFVNEKATTKNLIAKVKSCSKKLKKGDLLVITYSGHGSQMHDFNKDEQGKEDGTWCFYDRQLIDDELRHLWGLFKKGTNILVILDACHSGTSFKALFGKGRNRSFGAIADGLDEFRPRVKSMDQFKSGEVFNENKKVYRKIVNRESFPLDKIKASVQLMAACQDEEQALAGSIISYFTDFILSTIGNTKKIKNYKQLFDAVKKKSQKEIKVTPNWASIGPETDFFLKNRPFVKKGKRYPRDFKNIHEELIFGDFTAESKGLQMDGLIIDAPKTAQKSLLEMTPAKPITNVGKTKSAKAAKATSKEELFFVDAPTFKSISHPWDQAYAFYKILDKQSKGLFVEPSFYESRKQTHGSANKSSKAVGPEATNNYMPKWPNPQGHEQEFVWHMSLEHSQLAAARESVIKSTKAADRKIKVAHLDTGYSPKHPAAPKHLTNGISFVKGEPKNPGHEVVDKGTLAENEFHGTGTIAYLAGGELKASQTFDGYEGPFGGVPFAQVVPIRISDTVALIGILNNTKQFAQAVDYAIANNCEVISMSMGGQPHRSWAKSINRAYEAGITIVTAAGNSFNSGAMRILPRKLIYPARFERVIAATGITFNGEPYSFDANSHYPTKMAGGDNMQGNHGPKSAMSTAIAAYTPNLPWAEMKNSKPIFNKSGGGTSAATPQVAAAAALWIVKHKKALVKKGYAGTWRQVEAVKHALFTSADKSYPLWEKYYGNGSLKALNALSVLPPESRKLKQAKKARVTPFALLEFIQLLIFRKSAGRPNEAPKPDKNLEEMLSLEMLQILHKDAALHHYIEELDLFEKGSLNKEQFKFIFNKVKASPFASNFLKSLNNGKNF